MQEGGEEGGQCIKTRTSFGPAIIKLNRNRINVPDISANLPPQTNNISMCFFHLIFD